jgi:HPt (histidine-containing phosphotransfer) domain-containing protein
MTTPSFDHDELMERIDDDLEFLEESIEIFDEDAGSLLDQIREAAASRDAEALVIPAHTFKGLVSNFCADAAHTAARELEARGRENRLDDVDALVGTLNAETTRLRSELQAFLEAKRS